jgi:hypothetical protein
MKLTREQECKVAAHCESLSKTQAQPEAQPTPDVVEQQVTAILQAVVKETNEKWVAAAEKVARVKEGK